MGAAISTIRVLLVDDHELLRAGLRSALAEAAGVEVVGEASHGRDAVQLAKELRPDVVLLDLAMPELDGLETARRITRAAPRSRILILSGYADEAYVTRALSAGAAGYALKGESPEVLVKAIHSVHAGGEWFSERLAKTVAKAKGGDLPKSPLTHREREVLKLLAEGLTVREVAEILGLSQKTVDTHKTNLMKKLQLRNRVQLVRYAAAEKMIEV